MDVVPRTGAGCLMLFGAFMLAVAVSALVEEKFDVLPVLTAIAIATSGGGFYWLRSTLRSERKLRQQYDQKAILGAAARHGGRVTLAQITLETELDADDAAEAVGLLCGQGIARAELLDDGTVLYRFSGLLGEAEEGERPNAGPGA